MSNGGAWVPSASVMAPPSQTNVGLTRGSAGTRADRSGRLRNVTDRQKRPNILFVLSDQERSWSWLPPSVRLPVAGAAPGRGPHPRQPLDALGALLAVADHDPDRPARAPAPRGRQHRLPVAPLARHRGAHGRVGAARRRLPVELHRQVAPVLRADARHGGLRLHRLGGQRPALHGLGRHRRALRPGHRRQRGPVAAPQRHRARPAVVPHRRPGQPARRHVVPHRPAGVAGRPPRRAELGPGAAGRLEVEGRRRRCPPTPRTTPRSSTSCPPTSTTTSSPSRRASGSGGGTSSTASGAPSTATTPGPGAASLDYYVRLHELADESLGMVLQAPRGRRGLGRHDRGVHLRPRRHVRLARPAVEGAVRLRRDHEGARGGAGAGPHGRRAPPPAPLTSHVDLARTICGLAGAEPAAGDAGRRPGPGAGRPARPPCATRCCSATPRPTPPTSGRRAWQVRGSFDGRYKYARYFGVGGGLPNDDLSGRPTPMLYGPDAAFEDQEHELYDLQEDPHELVNLAMDPAAAPRCSARFDRPAGARGRRDGLTRLPVGVTGGQPPAAVGRRRGRRGRGAGCGPGRRAPSRGRPRRTPRTRSRRRPRRRRRRRPRGRGPGGR